MNFSTKIKMAEVVSGMREAELARQFGTSPQAFNQRMKTGKFTYEEMEQIASILGCTWRAEFVFPDGTTV